MAEAKRGRRWRRAGLMFLGLTLAGLAWSRVRVWARPAVPGPTAAQKAQAGRVKILRDRWGVPHIFGEKDADTAFGLAYSHAEDDWPTIEKVLAATRGQLARYEFSERAMQNDFYAAFFRVSERAAEQYPKLSDELRAVFEGYAAGLNYWAALHPEEVDSRFYPYRGVDFAAGFLHKIPFLFKTADTLGAVVAAEKLAVGDVVQERVLSPAERKGSNSQAIAPSRSADGVCRININSHQPWTGPVAWHEIHLVSGEGWNMTGGTFPGSPMVFHGHNEFLGWAHTVNAPDLVDVYKLTRDPKDAGAYVLDGASRPLERRRARIAIDTGLFTYEHAVDFYDVEQGPALETEAGLFAIRVAGADRMMLAAEQWFRMNKARSREEFEAAMAIHALPMFNVVYADRSNIAYVYNAVMPLRAEGADGFRVLDGSRGELIWKKYLPYAALPRVVNPPSGFVQNCNSAPWGTTVGAGNPRREDFAESFGIESRMTNRSIRSRELFGGDESISREEFFRYKWDRKYSPASPIYAELIEPLLSGFEPADEDERAALELLRSWDGETGEDSAGATLAILSYRPMIYGVILKRTNDLPPPAEVFRGAIAFLKERYGKVEVPLGTVQRLRVGSVDIGVGGGPDVMNAVHAELVEDKLVGSAGDSYVLIAEFTEEGARSWAVHQYGNVNRPGSKHYDDQAAMFARRELRESLRSEAAIRAALEEEYHPGEEAALGP